ncbi:MAG: hypothetical protein ACK5LG_21875 [Bacteroides thetaiotaomicron]
MIEQAVSARKVSSACNLWHGADNMSTRLATVVDQLTMLCAMVDKRLLEEEPKMPSSAQDAHERMGLLADLEHMQKMHHSQLDTIERKLSLLLNVMD